MTVPTEHAEQVTLISEFEKRWPDLRILAIPNGGFRHKNTAKMLQAEGVRKGVPDLFVPALNLWIELKRTKGGRVSPEQRDWIDYLNSIGHTAVVARGYLDALEQIEKVIKTKAL